MLSDGMVKRGHKIRICTAEPKFYKLPFFKKWMGYIDQYVLFPRKISRLLNYTGNDTLFVFADHALGPWVPWVSDRPHVIHCHDFLAQKSALGRIFENKTSWTGKLYQAYIHKGYSRGSNFISVSEKTKADLSEFLQEEPFRSDVVYNGLNPAFRPLESAPTRAEIGTLIHRDVSSGFLLHVGGNQWYKNRIGLLKIYNAWRKISDLQLPILLVGPKASPQLQTSWEASPYRSDILLMADMDDDFVRKAYAGASLFVFPSLAEGFGWPIAEAMASGCPVITTDEAPMTEVAGKAAMLIPRMPETAELQNEWALQSAMKIEEALHLDEKKKKKMITNGIENSKRFDLEKTLDRIEAIYAEVLVKA